jgi:hypothetical protein
VLLVLSARKPCRRPKRENCARSNARPGVLEQGRPSAELPLSSSDELCLVDPVETEPAKRVAQTHSRLCSQKPATVKSTSGLKGRIKRTASGRRFVVQVDFIQQGASVLLDDFALARIDESSVIFRRWLRPGPGELAQTRYTVSSRGGIWADGVTRERRRHFWVMVGQLLLPRPALKDRVAEHLRKQIAANEAADAKRIGWTSE